MAEIQPAPRAAMALTKTMQRVPPESASYWAIPDRADQILSALMEGENAFERTAEALLSGMRDTRDRTWDPLIRKGAIMAMRALHRAGLNGQDLPNVTAAGFALLGALRVLPDSWAVESAKDLVNAIMDAVQDREDLC